MMMVSFLSHPIVLSNVFGSTVDFPKILSIIRHNAMNLSSGREIISLRVSRIHPNVILIFAETPSAVDFLLK